MSTPAFTKLAEFERLLSESPEADLDAREKAQGRNAVLTKPAGSLGRLEEIAIWYAGWRGEAAPQVQAPQIVIFAGNHGVTAQGISAFPSEVTAQMVANFAAGGAAINQLAQQAGAALSVVQLKLDTPTADFTHGPAMTEEELLEALQAGWDAVDRNADLFVAGEMGIGNTTAAAAICYGLYGGAPSEWVGAGTGLDADGIAHKSTVVARAVELNRPSGPLDVLRCLGGREIAAMVGAYARARHSRIPVIIDGFIATAAAAVLHELAPESLDHAIAAHRSDEKAHDALLKRINKAPLLDLGMRLGEGSGAALAILIVKAAIACHSSMATFAEAGVSDG